MIALYNINVYTVCLCTTTVNQSATARYRYIRAMSSRSSDWDSEICHMHHSNALLRWSHVSLTSFNVGLR